MLKLLFLGWNSYCFQTSFPLFFFLVPPLLIVVPCFGSHKSLVVFNFSETEIRSERVDLSPFYSYSFFPLFSPPTPFPANRRNATTSEATWLIMNFMETDSLKVFPYVCSQYIPSSLNGSTDVCKGWKWLQDVTKQSDDRHGTVGGPFWKTRCPGCWPPSCIGSGFKDHPPFRAFKKFLIKTSHEDVSFFSPSISPPSYPSWLLPSLLLSSYRPAYSAQTSIECLFPLPREEM